MKCAVCGSPEGDGPCRECRALALEMRANAEALAELRYERISQRRPVYPWLMAAAAAVLFSLMFPRAVQRQPAAAPPEATETMTIKMLTPDPTVVIYWLADMKEEKR